MGETEPDQVWPVDDQFRQRIEQEVGYKGILELMWDDEDEDMRRMIKSAQRDETDFELLVDRARLVKRGVEKAQLRRDVESGDEEGRFWRSAGAQLRREWLAQADEERALAYSACLAQKAAERADVQAVRWLWNRESLSEYRLVDFLQSPATRFFTVEQVATMGIDPQTENCSINASYVVDDIGMHQIDVDLNHPELPTEFLDHDDTHLFEIDCASCETMVTAFRGPERKIRSAQVWVPLDLNGAEYRRSTVMFWESSILDEVRAVAETLSREFPWTLGQAYSFILTGVIPSIGCITGKVELTRTSEFDNATITMRISPWASPERVEKTFRIWRNYILGPKPQPFESHSLKLMQFVASDYVRTELQGLCKRTRRELREAWNTTNPQWKFTNQASFDRSYSRNLNKILWLDKIDPSLQYYSGFDEDDEGVILF